jgi:hypothetical protein
MASVNRTRAQLVKTEAAVGRSLSILEESAHSAELAAETVAALPQLSHPKSGRDPTKIARLFYSLMGFQILLNVVDGCLPASLVSISSEVRV